MNKSKPDFTAEDLTEFVKNFGNPVSAELRKKVMTRIDAVDREIEKEKLTPSPPIREPKPRAPERDEPEGRGD